MPEPSPRRRSLGRICAAWTCWLIGSHVLLAPGVVAYAVWELGRDEGFGNVLTTGPGLILVGIGVLSSLSTAGFLLAGWEYFRGRDRRGHWMNGVAAVTLILSGVPIAWMHWSGN